MRKKGFTLIETLIAMMILAGALIVLGNSWSGSLNSIRKSRLVSTMSLLLQRKMTEMELKYKDRPTSEIPEEDEGDFGEDYPEYTWKLESREITLPDMSSALTARDGGATEQEIMIVKKIQETIEKAVKEMRITVLYRRPGDSEEKPPYKHSLTTYMVEYLDGGGITP